MNSEFVIVGDCVARPRGWRRIVIDALCRYTGHLLWRSMGSAYRPKDASLDVYGVHCKRCYRWGYVEGDYRRREAIVPRDCTRPDGHEGPCNGWFIHPAGIK